MRLQSIELQDVGPFGHLRKDLVGQQVGITGPNGAGKSTLLSAIYYAVTGDLGRLGRSDAVNTLRYKPQESPFVRLHFYPGHTTSDPAVVLRKLPADGKDGTRRLAYGDHVWTAQADLVEQFERWTGLGTKALAEFVFVPQGGLDQVVRAPAPRRAEILQRVFGVAHAERICEAARERLARLPASTDAGVLATMRAGAVEALAAADRAIKAWEDTPRPDVNVERSDRELLAAAAAGESAHQARCAAEDALTAVVAAAPIPPTEPKPTSDDVGSAEQLVHTWREFHKRMEAVTAAQQLANDINARAVVFGRLPVPRHPGAQPKPSDELVHLRDRRYTYQVIADAPTSGVAGVCPVCAGNLAPDVADASAAVAALSRLDTLERDFSTAQATYTVALDAYHAYVRNRNQLVKDASDAAERVERLSALVGASPSVPESEAVAASSKLRRLSIEWSTYERHAKDHAVRVVTAQNVVMQCPVVPRIPINAVHAADQRLAASAVLRSQEASLRARADALREAADAAVETVRQAEGRAAQAAHVSRWRDRVEEIRRVFHRDAAPATAVRSCLEGLTDDLNRRLANLAASFRVRVDGDGDLRADYRDGTRTRSVPADRTSPGEGFVLGLAWRLALLDRYAPKVGLLCLDEPTTGLDAERVSALKSALEAWRPHGSDRQFVIVTHERKLLPAFDTVVDLKVG